MDFEKLRCEGIFQTFKIIKNKNKNLKGQSMPVIFGVVQSMWKPHNITK